MAQQTITHKFFLLTSPLTDTWTDISSDVLLRDSKWEHGIKTAHPITRVASVGKLKMILRNDATSGTQYRYTPGHTNCLSGFGVKTKVKVVSYWRDYEKVVFVGWIPPNGIQQSSAPYIDLVSVDVYDWMYFALHNQVSLQSIGINKNLGSIGGDLAALVEAQPSRIDKFGYSEIFPNTNDTVRENTTILGELNKAVLSEMGFAYVKYEEGGALDILALEGRLTRDGLATVDYYPMLDTELDRLTTETVATVFVICGEGGAAGYYHPNGTNSGRPKYTNSNNIDIWWNGSAWLLGDMGSSIFYGSTADVATPDLAGGWTVVTGGAPTPTIYKMHYITDESGNKLLIDERGTFAYLPDIIDYKVVHGAYYANRVSGKAYPREVGSSSVIFRLNEPIEVKAGEAVENLRIRYLVKEGYVSVSASDVSVTDYEMNSQEDGLGSDLTSNLTITPTFGSGDAQLKLENIGFIDGWVTVLELSGLPVYIGDPITQLVDVDTTAGLYYGKIEMLLDQKYQVDPTRTLDQITLLAVRYSTMTNTIEQVTFCVNTDEALASVYMFCDVGSKIPLKHTAFEIDEPYIIQGMDVWMQGTATFCRLYVKPSRYDTYSFWELAVAGSSELGSTTVLGIEA